MYYYTTGKKKKKKTINIQKVQATPSREGGMVGRRWSHSDAFATRMRSVPYNINRTIWENTERSRDAEIFK